MNPIILPLDLDKILDQTMLFIFGISRKTLNLKPFRLGIRVAQSSAAVEYTDSTFSEG